ncbi:hypothetical protein AGABI2DRAFT_70165 [Agaricus bisporus var. bisporus H97]|uniref:hypothetical protein n=1 Tax=Agaricus bisporus var. bisporus (strain H97 / ATCC MYA-4626 / FGSC 10389) TaxID=936046 RepID=UPI00029F7661|nr:hypothetical protein AGABI2DRAFT_70165 [Agaricus bisporus var. bisporus H97]EKV47590.1 hypothetical protein AGABI2DRAFT_70165 [Agaricus bisporus var. bisporus H97]
MEGDNVGRRPHDSRIVILGAGCFGLSTAYHLSLRGYTNITVLERSTILPAPDASSNDINRIVRSSYNDKFYSALAREAINAWKDRKLWGNTYHEYVHSKIRGWMVSASLAYANESFINDLELGCSVLPLPDPASVRSVLPSDARIGSFEGDGSVYYRRTGYLNRDGGWADAGQGIRILMSEVQKLGVKVLPGKSVTNILWDDRKATGISCADGSTYDADLVVIATGSWTPSAFPDLDLRGQFVAMIQLTEDEAEHLRSSPVVLDFLHGFYCFPPTDKNILKVAIHGPGHLHTANGAISTPRTILSHPDNGSAIPKSSLPLLRKCLRELYPDIAEKPFRGTRLCWYNDAPDGNWMIGRYPSAENLILATCGSGHAYKVSECDFGVYSPFTCDSLVSSRNGSSCGGSDRR